ncbi:hypothetical protein [Flavivirga algicola]|uniref:Lipoprotein n=1 Tax=Flavivirga algicola TaxID=2729136 RepID=A0ABX1RVW4_9FLAO|nr:hypothetical protein [Flavivirga algicola]NMH87705.1 hypothetical protein [Flavivirga algicola]
MRFLKTISILTIFLMASCLLDNKTANIYSYEINSRAEKIETLKKYLIKTSGLVDAEYHIWFQDNGTGRIPGPSDYNIKLALKIDKDSIDSWINHLEPSSKKISIENWKGLKLNNEVWLLNSKPELYHSSSKTEIKLVFRKEHVILGIYSTTPLTLDDIDA